MSSYYYIDDPNSEFGSLPVPEDDYEESKNTRRIIR